MSFAPESRFVGIADDEAETDDVADDDAETDDGRGLQDVLYDGSPSDAEISLSDKIHNLERALDRLSRRIADMSQRLGYIESFVSRCTQCFGGTR